MNNVIPAERAGFLPWTRSRLLNAWVDNLTIPEIIERLDEGMLFTLNPDHLYHLQRNPDFAAAYRDAVMVSSDSKYVYWALGLIGRRIQCKTSGSDIVPAYYRHHAANPDVRIFFLGARPGIAQRALERVNGIVGRNIVVGAHGPSFNFVNDADETRDVIEMINASGATCLIVGLGAPKQEVWMHRNRHRMPGVKVYMGVGAVIDYEAEAVKRAPAWMNRVRRGGLPGGPAAPPRYGGRYAGTREFFGQARRAGRGFWRPPPFPPPASESGRVITPLSRHVWASNETR